MSDFIAVDRKMEIKRPFIMGIVNASPDSFSDEGRYRTVQSQLDRARTVIESGADIVDIGAQTASTDVPEISEQEEIDRLMPILNWTLSNSDALVSIDTYRSAVAREALSAGAHIINDIGFLHDNNMIETIRDSGAGYILMHNPGPPKVLLKNYDFYSNVVDNVLEAMIQKNQQLISGGVLSEQIILDPGPDFAKSHTQTVDVLRNIDQLASIGRPLLLPISRKGYIGAVTGRPPSERLAGTLASIGFSLNITRSIVFRVHDVAEAVDFIKVWDLLNQYLEIEE